MNSLNATGPNAEMIRYWNEQTGPKWVALEDHLDQQISGLGECAMDRAEIRPGESVLDVGCGCGQSALQLAGRVGSSGRVVGIDISTVMLERARQRAAGTDQVCFENADAQTHPFPVAAFDLVFSRFGVMFFHDPGAAFKNLHSALHPEGRLVFVCWQALSANPWMAVPLGALAAVVELPSPPAPGAPGPFSFADIGRLGEILDGAGFRRIGFEPQEGELALGGMVALDQAVDFVAQLGPAAAILREASLETRSRARAAIRTALEPHATPAGVKMSYGTWVVTADAA